MNDSGNRIVVIDHERYGVRTECSSIEEAERCIKECGDAFSDTRFSVCGDDIIDERGDIVGYHVEIPSMAKQTPRQYPATPYCRAD